MATIKPYQVNIAQDQIDDLKSRLENTIMPSEVKNGGWAYGPTNEYIEDMIDSIVSGEYDWRKAEAKLNSYPQFTTEVDGQEIYFMHIESKVKDATPLMLIHGWPGSIVEFLDVIEPLTDPVKHGGKEEDAFHLVIPSIPGFGFSGPTTEAGWNNDRIAAAFDAMMDLVFERRPFLPYPILHATEQAALGNAPSNTRLWDAQLKDRYLLQQRLGDLQNHPVLALWGDSDRVFDRSGLSPLQKLLPQAQLEALPGIGHLPMMEAPADTAQRYARFLEGLAPPSALAPQKIQQK